MWGCLTGRKKIAGDEAETVVRSYIATFQDKLPGKVIRPATLPLIRNRAIEDAIGLPDIDSEGNVFEGKKIKVEKSFRWTNPDEMQKLSSQDLGERIREQAKAEGIKGHEILGLQNILDHAEK